MVVQQPVIKNKVYRRCVRSDFSAKHSGEKQKSSVVTELFLQQTDTFTLVKQHYLLHE